MGKFPISRSTGSGFVPMPQSYLVIVNVSFWDGEIHCPKSIMVRNHSLFTLESITIDGSTFQLLFDHVSSGRGLNFLFLELYFQRSESYSR